MSILVGVDGGSRKTYAVVVDEEGRLLGAGDAGASNWELARIPITGNAASQLRTDASARFWSDHR